MHRVEFSSWSKSGSAVLLPDVRSSTSGGNNTMDSFVSKFIQHGIAYVYDLLSVAALEINTLACDCEPLFDMPSCELITLIIFLFL